MRRSLLMSMLAMGMCMASSSPYSLRRDPSSEDSADHSKNIKPYHSKPAKKVRCKRNYRRNSVNR